jgi:integrase
VSTGRPRRRRKLERFETDVLSGFVLARASAGLADGTIRGDVGHLEQIRTWFGRPLWDMEPADADVYFGKVLRNSPSGTRLARSQALTTYFMFLELRHKVEIHRMTGRVVECPIDEMNRPRGAKDAQLRIPPTEPEVGILFTGWVGELATYRGPRPLEPEHINTSVAAIDKPTDRLALALAAVHAARSGAIRRLQLDDLDIGNRKLTIDGRTRRLDDLTLHVAREWLEFRRRR